MGVGGKHSKDLCTGQDGFLVWKTALGSPLHLSCHRESPTTSSTRPAQKPASRVSASYSSLVFWMQRHLLWAPVSSRPTWSHDPEGQRVHTHELGECRAQARQRDKGRGRELLYSPEIILAWLWDGLGAFTKEPINFPSFCGLLVGLPPNQSLLSPGQTDRPLWSSTSP